MPFLNPDTLDEDGPPRHRYNFGLRALAAAVTSLAGTLALTACSAAHQPTTSTGTVNLTVVWPIGRQPAAGSCAGRITWTAIPPANAGRPAAGITPSPTPYVQAFVNVPPRVVGKPSGSATATPVPYLPPDGETQYVCVFHRPSMGGLGLGSWTFQASNNAGWSASCSRKIIGGINSVVFTVMKAGCS